MSVGVYSPRDGYSMSGASANTTGSAFDFRASNGFFLSRIQASGLAAGFANSGIVQIQHSIDATAYDTIAAITASAGSTINTWFSAGAYGYIRSLTTIYSGATGTGVITHQFMPGYV